MSGTPIVNVAPAKASTVRAAARTLARRLRSVLLSYHEDKMARRAFMNTCHLDDRMLNDIGVTREEVEWAARLPLRVNASQALHERACARRAGEALQERSPGLQTTGGS